jgi:hypothetical protein
MSASELAQLGGGGATHTKVCSRDSLPLVGRGDPRSGGVGVAPRTCVHEPRQKFSKLIPPPPDPSYCLPRPPHHKRDHDEWLVGWRLGGSAVVPAQAKAEGAGPCDARAQPLSTRPSATMQSGRGPESCRAWAVGNRERCDQPWSAATRPSGPVAMRHGNWSPGSQSHTPKTPIGRRGVSLISSADYPRGAKASPARRFAL